MLKHVMIVGGGVGGTIVANLLARHLSPSEAQVTLIESTGKHAYMPGWLYMPFNREGADSAWTRIPASQSLADQSFISALQHFCDYEVSFTEYAVSW